LKALPDFLSLAEAFKRVVNIIRQAEGRNQPFTVGGPVNEALFEKESERSLWRAFQELGKTVDELLGRDEVEEAMFKLAALKAPVDLFFDEVMVMAENPDVRQNRLAILKNIADLFARFADFSKIST
jgi:glycyl-tRNA synthetase beta chain